MDVYSFGVLMWELLYEKEPFDGDLSSAIQYVVDEDARPRIITLATTDALVRDTVDLDSVRFT